MSPRSAFMQLITKAAIGFAALFLVGVVLAAIPNHRAPAMVAAPVNLIDLSEQAQDVGQAMDHSKMPGMSPVMSMDMGDEKSAEAAATHDMAHMHHGDNPHMHMTSAPKAFMQPRVLWQSWAAAKLRSSLVPSARAAIMA